METKTKDPDARLDYRRDWTEWLPEGDAISTSTWIVPEGLIGGDESNNDTSATI